MKPFRIVTGSNLGRSAPGDRETGGWLAAGPASQVLGGVTGIGKNLYDRQRDRGVRETGLIIAPNKTLAAQLFVSSKPFSDNAVEYFVSYYDYYQPEATSPHGHLYREGLLDQRTSTNCAKRRPIPCWIAGM